MRRLLTGFTALLGCGALSMAYARSVLSASIFFSLAGIGHAACWTPVVALVQRWVPEQRRGAALGITSMGGGVGMAAWSLALPIIVNRFSWNAGWISMGLFSFLVASMNFFLIHSHPETKSPYSYRPVTRHPGQGSSARLRQLFRTKPLWLTRPLLSHGGIHRTGTLYLL